MSVRIPSVVLAVFAALLASCSTFYDARFVPAPLEMALEDTATPELSGRALISVVGIRRADRHARTPAQFEVILRLEIRVFYPSASIRRPSSSSPRTCNPSKARAFGPNRRRPSNKAARLSSK